MLLQIIVFFSVTLICVILYTIKSIAVIKCSTFIGAIITAAAFGVNTIAIKLTAGTALYISIPLTVIANFIGVYIAKYLMKFIQKDRLWRISCTVSNRHVGALDCIVTLLTKYNIEYAKIPYEQGTIVDIFSKTQGESDLIKEIIITNNIKYTIYEIDKSL